MATPQVIAIVEELERTLLEFIRTHQINHDDYRQATDLIIASIKGGEESLLFDVFLEAEATDVGGAHGSGSINGIEGPFYLPGAPALERPYVLPQRPQERGDLLTFRGTVRSSDGAQLGGAELDVWQADADGLYSGIHPGLPEWNLRGRFTTGPDGTFAVTTRVPPPYEIPKDGATGTLLNALGRHFYRPAHLHVKVRADGHQDLTSQLYFQGGEYLDSDVANAVRDGLVVELQHEGDQQLVEYDFVLDPARRAVSA